MPYRSTRLQLMYDTDPEAELPPLASQVEACPPHHYLIESPNGGQSSPGACKKCGETREYRNWLEQYEYMGTGWKQAV